MKFVRILFLFFFANILYVNAADIQLNESANKFAVVNNTNQEFTFVNHLSVINSMMVKTKVGDFYQLIVPGYGSNAANGTAELPVLQKLIQLPYGADIGIQIIEQEEEVISLNDFGIDLPLFPNQPSLSKSEDAASAKFHFNKDAYLLDEFTNNKIVRTEFLGTMRGQQLARISVAPIRYNPVTNELKIITKLEVKVVFEHIDRSKNDALKQKYYAAEFEHLFKKCINYLPTSTKDVITTYPVKYVIIADPMYQNALQDLVEWKTKKGFIVVEGYTNDPNVGNTTTSIKAFIKDMYDNATAADPAPTYLLLVGDEPQVPSFSAGGGGHVSDMYYCEFDGGGDFYPEMYYGRFSAVTVEDVESQVAKTLTHELYTFPNTAFLDEAVLVAGVDAGMAPTHGNGQINYGTDNYFNAAHNLTIHNYLYGSGTPITSDMPAASAAIIADVSDGVGFANYTAHCGSSGWSDPSFSTADVPSLQNDNEFGLIIGNCCQSNKFDVPVCFGEALLRADNRGAVGYIGGSNNTYWNEDFWWAVGNTSNITANPTYSGTGLGIYDCLMHENGEQQADWFITQGQMIHSGNLAVTQAAGAEQYYWEIYHLMGDPSLMPYIGVPTPLTVSHIAAVPVGTTALTVTTEEHAYVAISMNGVLLDAQLADVTGVVNLAFNAIANVGTADIIITKQFKEPYIGTVQIIAPNGPYVIYANHIIDDPTGNNNGLADYEELIELDVNIQNVGSVNANSIDVVLSSNDPYITVIDSTEHVTVINAAQTLNINTPFTMQLANYIPDQHTALFNLDMTDNLGNTWMSTLNITLNAPIIDHTTFTIDDVTTGNGNGKLDAGETLDLIIGVENSGHATIDNLIASLGSLSAFVTINQSSVNVTNINVSQQQNAVFNITIAANTPVGTLAEFPFDITDGIYAHQHTFSATIGVIDEDYETGDFTQYSWIQGAFPWSVDNGQIYEGNYSSRSAIGLPDDEESELSIVLDVIAAGDISFYKFVSSEQYDYLKFKINGNKVGEWSGEDVNWSYISYPVTPGQTTFKWEYEKDGSIAQGQDAAWIDYIVFPPIDLGMTDIHETNINIEIFPNPTMGVFTLSFADDTHHNIEVVDAAGKRVKYLADATQQTTLNLTELSAGTYYIKVFPEDVLYQIIKQ